MQFIPVADIHVADNRQRREFDSQALVDLGDSIAKIGLLQPLVVRYENGQAILVAGERRLRSLIDIWALGGIFRFNGAAVAEGIVPTVSLGDLSYIDAFEAELEENIRRVDLTWQESAQAWKDLHTFRGQQNPSQSISDTASEINNGLANPVPRDTIAKSIQVARYLDDADVAKAKTVKEAFKIIERKELEADNVKRAAFVGRTFGGHSHTLLMGNCVEILRTMPAGEFDVVCTDPPYGMGADDFGDAAGKLLGIDHTYDDSPESFSQLMALVAPLITHVAKPAAHLYLCCDIDQFFFLRALFNELQWNVFRTPLINHKTGSGRVPLPEHGPRRTYETILYAYRGGKPCTAIYPDVVSTAGDDNLGHGAQKPVALFQDLLKRSVRPGDKVLDPFAGTGTIFPAAHSLKCLATGVELEAKYFGIAAKRIEELE